MRSTASFAGLLVAALAAHALAATHAEAAHPAGTLMHASADPVILVVETVPAVPDYPIVIDGEIHRTGQHGVLAVELDPGDHTISVDDLVEVDADTRILFHRWQDGWDRERLDSINRSRTLTLGLLIQHRMGFRFTDALENDVPRNRIQSIVLMNSNGDQLTLSDGEGEENGEELAGSIDSAWLTANRVRRTGAGLRAREAFYVYREINLDGKNVVQSGAEKFVPEPGVDREVVLHVFSLEVEVKSFVYNRPVTGELALYDIGAAAGDDPVAVTAVVDGVGVFDQLPRGDYEVVMLSGGSGLRAPVILTGPKVERITVVTSQLWWIIAPLVGLLAGSAVVSVIRPRSRIALLIVWATVAVVGLSTPSIGSALNRPLSATAEPIYSASGQFIGIATEVQNRSPVSISQSYCRPDFELRIITDNGVWMASFESHDFHDAEFGECQVHKIAPGMSRNVFSPFQGQEWVVHSESIPPPGSYEALIRVFGVPAKSISLTIDEGFLEGALTPAVVDDPFDENPYTNPFED